MPNAPDHNATRGLFNRLRAEFAKRQGVKAKDIDWSKVSPGEAWRLAEEQFKVTNTPSKFVDAYFREFNKYLEKVQ
jgi:hypothetical protein